MKKRAVILLLFAMLLLSACAGAGDWRYVLPNGYEICRVNGEAVIFGIRDGDTVSEAVAGSVQAFCYGERFVALQMGDDQTLEYFLVDTQGAACYYAADEAELQQTCESLGVTDLCDWIRTSPAPKGAVFD